MEGKEACIYYGAFEALQSVRLRLNTYKTLILLAALWAAHKLSSPSLREGVMTYFAFSQPSTPRERVPFSLVRFPDHNCCVFRIMWFLVLTLGTTLHSRLKIYFSVFLPKKKGIVFSAKNAESFYINSEKNHTDKFFIAINTCLRYWYRYQFDW